METSDGSSVVFGRIPRSVSRRRVREWADSIDESVAKGRSWCCLVSDDEELRGLNHRFRGKDAPTDVLSFPSTAKAHKPLAAAPRARGTREASSRPASLLCASSSEAQRPLAAAPRARRTREAPSRPASPFCTSSSEEALGDIAISVERAVEQAHRFGHSVEEEIGVLMLHGVLHLLGMDHERDGGRMRRTEMRWRRALGLPLGLIERVRT